MTIFAVICAGMFPGIHVGRAWFAYWMFPIAEPDGIVAQLPQSIGVGCICRRNLLHRLVVVLVHGNDPGSRNATGSGQALPCSKVGLWRYFRSAGPVPIASGMSTSVPILLLAASGHPAGTVGALRGVLRLRGLADSRLAHDDLSRPISLQGAIFSGFAMVMTLARACSTTLRAQGCDHPQAPRKHEQDHHAHRHAGRVCLRTGVLHGLVRWCKGREIRLHQSCFRTVCLGLLDHGLLQRVIASDLLVQEDAYQHLGDVHHQYLREHRHVVRALRHRRDEPCQRLHH